jgi:hypothetical protein
MLSWIPAQPGRYFLSGGNHAESRTERVFPGGVTRKCLKAGEQVLAPCLGRSLPEKATCHLPVSKRQYRNPFHVRPVPGRANVHRHGLRASSGYPDQPRPPRQATWNARLWFLKAM